jgi:hypothetical protein
MDHFTPAATKRRNDFSIVPVSVRTRACLMSAAVAVLGFQSPTI